MPKRLATMASTLAQDISVDSDEIVAAIDYMDMKLRGAEADNKPVPFVAFRTRTILTAALKLRREAEISM
ncbi:hypothetical protein ABID21_002660 [Pseudorhizobium tarimense]|uniref:Uncharacterized protein n=1 Tax=Pseudorhizobium tarimense TaxID=1079109 RepID=A0ABV2H7L7_9HYPH|nr:hypothetical protein [Pseudorhizobium tarimense]MCJ8519619.1 hypothetical protein [Pseudorhizobium tarimense]